MNKIAVFGGGCFWCTEAIFKNLRGVSSVLPGYAGGHIDHPTYEQVSSGTTGHVEVIQIEYDPDVIRFRDLVEVFFATHDPTTLNRQGNDVGEQYRSVVFYTDDEQKQDAENIIQELTEAKACADPIVTTVEPHKQFFEAEDYHKNYFERNPGNPYCQIVINPKIKKFKEKFVSLMK